MAQTKIVRCDECGVVKNVSNHWFGILAGRGGHGSSCFIAERWRPGGVYEYDLCGEACTIKALGKWMHANVPALDTKGI